MFKYHWSNPRFAGLPWSVDKKKETSQVREDELLAGRCTKRNRETSQGIPWRPLVVHVLLNLPGLPRSKALMGAASKLAVIPVSLPRLEPGTF